MSLLRTGTETKGFGGDSGLERGEDGIGCGRGRGAV